MMTSLLVWLSSPSCSDVSSRMALMSAPAEKNRSDALPMMTTFTLVSKRMASAACPSSSIMARWWALAGGRLSVSMATPSSSEVRKNSSVRSRYAFGITFSFSQYERAHGVVEDGGCGRGVQKAGGDERGGAGVDLFQPGAVAAPACLHRRLHARAQARVLAGDREPAAHVIAMERFLAQHALGARAQPRVTAARQRLQPQQHGRVERGQRGEDVRPAVQLGDEIGIGRRRRHVEAVL